MFIFLTIDTLLRMQSCLIVYQICISVVSSETEPSYEFTGCLCSFKKYLFNFIVYLSSILAVLGSSSWCAAFMLWLSFPCWRGYLHVVMINVQLLQRDTMPKASHESKHLMGTSWQVWRTSQRSSWPEADTRGAGAVAGSSTFWPTGKRDARPWAALKSHRLLQQHSSWSFPDSPWPRSKHANIWSHVAILIPTTTYILTLLPEIASALQAVSLEARKPLGLVDLKKFYVCLKKHICTIPEQELYR